MAAALVGALYIAMMKTILYAHGGCSSHHQRDKGQRLMTFLVTDESGDHILIDEEERGGTNAMAVVLAMREALIWAKANDVDDLEIRVSLQNVLPRPQGYGEDASPVHRTIDALRRERNATIVWIPKAENEAATHLEIRKLAAALGPKCEALTSPLSLA